MHNPFTEEHEAFRKTVRQYVEKELTPHALEWDRAGIFPRELFQQCGELGFFGINHDP
ncbi:MAG TPA: acyl-CoA dehydrogenase family protein, partial [Myxococcaceae bacterium]|nr:acyl-CoA dehydrogenase family protein [Myxococcaceae bacterium]